MIVSPTSVGLNTLLGSSSTWTWTYIQNQTRAVTEQFPPNVKFLLLAHPLHPKFLKQKPFW